MSTALVIGGGLAGAALATRLADAGRDVVLLERELTPTDKVCGEFLSREATHYLRGLDIDVTSLGAVPIHSVKIARAADVVESRLPFSALSLSRRVLDEALLHRAARAGADLRRGARVVTLDRDGAKWLTRLADDTTILAEDVFLATGKHDLRGKRRPAGSQNDLVAFKMHFTLSPRQHAQLRGHVEVSLFEGGYAGLEEVEDGRANLCLVARRRTLAQHGTFRSLLRAIRRTSPLLDQRLDEATPCAEKPLALSAIPYGYIASATDGLWRLGDQAAVIPSFSGDGMSIALHSAELAARAYLKGRSAEDYQVELGHDIRRQMLIATILSHALVRRGTQRGLSLLARAWPSIVAKVALHTRVSERAIQRPSLVGNA